VEIDKTILEGPDQHGGDDAHPTSHHDTIHTRVLEPRHECVIEILSCGVTTMVEGLAKDAETLSSSLGSAAFVVDDKKFNACIESLAAGCGKGLKIGPIPRRHHSKT